MRRRWSIKALESLTDRDLVLSLIDERMSDCKNVYAPMYRRLVVARRRISQQDVLTDRGFENGC